MRQGKNGDIDIKTEQARGRERAGKEGGGGGDRAQRLRDRATQRRTKTPRHRERDGLERRAEGMEGDRKDTAREREKERERASY